ncbi:MAG: hypothetical protein HMLKMBBP_03582 [Planctomycetes bacterium]|nr:hypothetical protein [Planctomycetota bacterium]
MDLAVSARGDLGGLLARLRDLGMLPGDVAVSGTVDLSARVAGRSASQGGAGFGVNVDRFVLVEKDARIEARGSIGADGAMDVSAKGSGDLGNLLGRARAGAPPVRGRFDFEATAKGPRDALLVSIPKFALDGDLRVTASGELRPTAAGDASVKANLRAQGRVDEAVALAKRLGFAFEFPLEGTLDADARVEGTVKAPVVPSFDVKLASAPLTLSAKGSVSADRRVTATASGSGDAALLRDLALRMKLADELPPVRGRIVFDAEAGGTADALAVPRAALSLREGPADLGVAGSMDAAGRIAADVTVSGTLARIAEFARDAGWTTTFLAPQGDLHLTAKVAGTRDRLAVPAADLRITGPTRMTASASWDPSAGVAVKGTIDGAIQPILDAAAQASGKPPQRLDGTLSVSFDASGPADRLAANVPAFSVRTQGLTVAGKAARAASGDTSGDARVTGSVADLLRVLAAFGAAEGTEASGALDATVSGSMVGGRAEGSLAATATDVAYTLSDGVFREPRIVVSAPRIVWDRERGTLEPVTLDIAADGAKLTAVIDRGAPKAAAPDAAPPPPPPPGASAPGPETGATGDLVIERSFVQRHPELFGADVSFDRLTAPFRFSGDISGGRTHAATWTGTLDAAVVNAVAPNVTLTRLAFKADLAGGRALLKPIEGVLNGGPLSGEASLGLVGDDPEHRIDLTVRDAKLDTALAPLLARASPVFAGAETGRTGGLAGVTAKLTARGFGSQRVRSSLNGSGEVVLKGAFVESTELLGAIFQFLGGSSRLEFGDARIPFDVRDGKVHTKEVALDAGTIAMKLGGDVLLDTQKIDYALKVKPRALGGAFEKYASLFDAEGYLPLRLKGSLSKPKLRGPDVGDALKEKAKDLLDGLLGKDDEDEKSAPRDGGGRKRRRDEKGADSEETPPPPPPPPPSKDPPPDDVPPPPPPPRR